VDKPHNNLIETIPPASEVRESLIATLLQVQLLRDLLKVAERKERQRSVPSRKAVLSARR
jgi:hypothetical protein